MFTSFFYRISSYADTSFYFKNVVYIEQALLKVTLVISYFNVTKDTKKLFTIISSLYFSYNL